MFNFSCKPIMLPAVILAFFLLNGCKQEAAKTMAKQPPVQVDVITLKTQPVKLEAELPGRTSCLSGCRGSASGKRHCQEAVLYRRQ